MLIVLNETGLRSSLWRRNIHEGVLKNSILELLDFKLFWRNMRQTPLEACGLIQHSQHFPRLSCKSGFGSLSSRSLVACFVLPNLSCALLFPQFAATSIEWCIYIKFSVLLYCQMHCCFTILVYFPYGFLPGLYGQFVSVTTHPISDSKLYWKDRPLPERQSEA